MEVASNGTWWIGWTDPDGQIRRDTQPFEGRVRPPRGRKQVELGRFHLPKPFALREEPEQPDISVRQEGSWKARPSYISSLRSTSS